MHGGRSGVEGGGLVKGANHCLRSRTMHTTHCSYRHLNNNNNNNGHLLEGPGFDFCPSGRLIEWYSPNGTLKKWPLAVKGRWPLRTD